MRWRALGCAICFASATLVLSLIAAVVLVLQ